MKKKRILALYSNFAEAMAVISDVRDHKVAGVSLDDVTVISPIEHPELVELLGDRPSHIRKFTLSGAITGITLGFTWIAAAQANFLVQPQGGKPVIPLPSNFVLTYELMILFSVFFTLAGLLITARLLRRRPMPYSAKVGVDQVGIELELEEKYIEPMKKLFLARQALEIREEGRS
ncbi:MAG: DUF3341 domain-containing protein [Chromatiales bacterium]|jgi:hypothetical protein|nr:DUF3341 domain-containing protein [Chromatiales bacterium]